MTNRVVNFNAGPSALPLAALERAQRELLDYQGTGMSIMEHSHRGKDYEAVHDEALSLTRELLQVPETHDILLMQGGARAQFALIPMNLLPADKSADYIITGTWAKQAWEEAQFCGKVRVACSTEVNGGFTRVPTQQELDLDPNAAYVHYTTNNTVYGSQFHYIPETGTVPLVADMSSDIMWKPIDVSKFGLIYAGAQKNVGPSGITYVIVRKDWIATGSKTLPKIFRYSEVAKNNSLQNTIATFPVYMIRNVLQTVKERGGLVAVEKENREKARILYEAIDNNADYYRGPVEKESRSFMNVVFRLPTEALEDKFVSEAKKAGMVGLKGHRMAGGIRASIYNAVPLSGVQKLVELMDTFRKAN